LALVVILAILILIFALTLPDGNILRIIFGLPFLLFLPGYSLVSALWVKKKELDGLERTALSLGLSIALVAFVGLGLNYTPMGITLNSILYSHFFLIIVLVGVTWFRRSQLNPEERFQMRSGIVYDTVDGISSTDKLVVLVIVIAIIVGGALLLFVAMNPPEEKFTELYIFDVNEETENYPTDLIVNESASIVIGVVSHEQQNTEYNISVWLRPVNGTDENRAQYSFSLGNDDKWQQDFAFNISQNGTYKLEIELYKENDTLPYATTHLWIDVRD
jgi:uncharacterized membrane protein